MTMTLYEKPVDPSWQPLLQQAWEHIDPHYKETLCKKTDWLPGPTHLFNAFSLPLPKVRYILFGESPYPRPLSANGYAFWDGKVTSLWSEKGLSKTVNRATSLRNIMKMLLVADNLLSPDNTTQEAIAAINKNHLVQTATDLFSHFLEAGFLLLNTTPVLSERPVRQEARYWYPFVSQLLTSLSEQASHIELILFGKVAETINTIAASHTFKCLYAEHPYNLSFINNPQVLDFFRPLHLLQR